MPYRIFPPEDILDTYVELPLSKSVSARTLILDAVAGCSTSTPVAQCDDTDALRNGLSVTTGTADAGLAGTALRFLLAYYAATPGCDIVLTGAPRLCQRPIAPLVDALRNLGADIQYIGDEGFAPMHIVGKRLSGGSITVNAGISSQFVSALMMIAPLMQAPLTLQLDGAPVSTSYIVMTARMMQQRGIDAAYDARLNTVHVPNTTPNTASIPVEADWSAASYWYAITALTAGWTTLLNARTPSIQGDSAMVEYGQRLGVLTNEYCPDDDEEQDDEEETQRPDVPDGALTLSASPEQFSRLDLDMSNTPDIVQTLAVAAAMLGMPFRFTGVSTLRGKETDRLQALANELLKTGVVMEIESDNIISWDGSRLPITELPVFNTYNDHRMAMAFAPVAIYIPGIVINNPEVVSKSYPQFWEHLAKAGFSIIDIDAAAAATPQ